MTDPDLLERRLNAQQAYADKLQEKYNREAAEHKKNVEEVSEVFIRSVWLFSEELFFHWLSFSERGSKTRKSFK